MKSGAMWEVVVGFTIYFLTFEVVVYIFQAL